MDYLHTTLLDNGVVDITLSQVDEIDPDPDNLAQPIWFLRNSAVFLLGPGADLQAGPDDEDAASTVIETGREMTLAALDVIRDLDLSAHPEIASIDMPERHDLKPGFDRKTGCTCGCSPGFPLYSRIWVNTRDGRRVYVNLYVTIAWDSVITAADSAIPVLATLA